MQGPAEEDGGTGLVEALPNVMARPRAAGGCGGLDAVAELRRRGVSCLQCVFAWARVCARACAQVGGWLGGCVQVGARACVNLVCAQAQ